MALVLEREAAWEDESVGYGSRLTHGLPIDPFRAAGVRTRRRTAPRAVALDAHHSIKMD